MLLNEIMMKESLYHCSNGVYQRICHYKMPFHCQGRAWSLMAGKCHISIQKYVNRCEHLCSFSTSDIPSYAKTADSNDLKIDSVKCPFPGNINRPCMHIRAWNCICDDNSYQNITLTNTAYVMCDFSFALFIHSSGLSLSSSFIAGASWDLLHLAWAELMQKHKRKIKTLKGLMEICEHEGIIDLKKPEKQGLLRCKH